MSGVPVSITVSVPRAAAEPVAVPLSTFSMGTLPAADAAWPYQANSMMGSFLIDSWKNVKPGDVLTDNRGTLEEVISIEKIDGEGIDRYRVRLRRAEGRACFEVSDEVHDDRDFSVWRDLTVISRVSETLIPDASSSDRTQQIAQLRQQTVEGMVNSLVNRSLGFADQAVMMLDRWGHGDAFTELRHYQGLLKVFKEALGHFDLSSYRTYSLLVSLFREEAARAGSGPGISALSSDRSLPGESYQEKVQVLSRLEKDSEKLGRDADRLRNAWLVLSTFRRESWILRGEHRGNEEFCPIPPVSTTLFRGKAPEMVIEGVSRLIAGDQISPDQEQVERRGIVCGTYSPEEFRAALKRGAHLLVSFDSFHPEQIRGFMLYYPPGSSLPDELQPLREHHPHLSTAVVDLVLVASDAPVGTFNHLFWGHRFALQATSEAKIHTGELLVQNLSSYKALIRRGAIADPLGVIQGDGWQTMTVPVDVDTYDSDDNPYAGMLVEKRKEETELWRSLTTGDLTPASVVSQALELPQRVHIHLPDWGDAVEPMDLENFVKYAGEGLQGFSGLLTGPVTRFYGEPQTADTARSSSGSAADVFGQLVQALPQSLSCGVFPYPKRQSWYRESGGTVEFAYPASTGMRASGGIMVLDRTVPHRVKTGIEQSGDLVSRGESLACDIAGELGRRSQGRGERAHQFLLVPQQALRSGEVAAAMRLWTEKAAKTPSFSVVIVADEAPADVQEILPGIFKVHGASQLRECLETLQAD